MSAMIYDWMPVETGAKTEAPANPSIKISKNYCREEEFRSALERYLADYRKHHAVIDHNAVNVCH